MKRRMISVVLSLAMALTLLPVTALAEDEEAGVPYQWCDGNGQNWETRYCETYTVVVSNITTWSTGWYVVPAGEPITIIERIEVSGSVNLILTDGGSLTAEQGIHVSGNGNSLTIYGQSEDPNSMGKLTATGGDSQAGIGGNSGSSSAGEANGPIAIYGGIVQATGGSGTASISTGGVGIGGGSVPGGGAGSGITIYGGMVTATGGNGYTDTGGGGGGAGIGGGGARSSTGGSGSDIVIYGGTVQATGGTGAGPTNNCRGGGAGIGGGGGDRGGTGGTGIAIYGGIVEATGGSGLSTGGGGGAAGIGGGGGPSGANLGGTASSITIGGGTVIAKGGTGTGSTAGRNGAAIGYGGQSGLGSGVAPNFAEDYSYIITDSNGSSTLFWKGSSSSFSWTRQELKIQPAAISMALTPETATIDLGEDEPHSVSFSASLTAKLEDDSTRSLTVAPEGVGEISVSVDRITFTAENVLGVVTITATTGIYHAACTVTVQQTGGTLQLGDTAVELNDGTAVPNEDGTVTVPKGSVVAPENGPEMTLPDGGTVDTDGAVIADEIVVGDTSVKGNGSDVKADKDGNVTVPDGGTVTPKNGPEMTLPDGGVVDEDGNVTLPGGGSVEIGDTTVTVPEGGTLKPDGKGGVEVSDGTTVTPENGPEMTLPDGGTVNTDGTVTVPEGGTVTPPNGPDITLPGGGTADTDGNITSKSSSVQIGDIEVTLPEDGTLKPDGKGGVEIPNGSKVTPPGGPDITVNDNAIVDEDGNVTFPEGGSAKVGDTTVTIPKGGTVTPNEDGTLDVPPGSIVKDKDGKETTVPSQGGKLDSAGNYTVNTMPSTDTPSTPDIPGTPGNPGSTGSSSPSTYPPTVSKADNGKVSTSPSNPKRGDTVTVSPTPDEGYKVGNVAVKDSNGNELEVKDNGDGTFSFTQPTGKVTIEVTFVPQKDETDSPVLTFSDLDPNAWYWESVDYVVRNGLMNGYGNGKFAPSDELSRAMLAQILYNAENRPGTDGGDSFIDVLSGAWYADAIAWATANGIVAGYGNGLYGPEDAITREQLAAML